MADQDFKINVITTADTAGLARTRQEMEALQRQTKDFLAGGPAQTGVEKFIAAQRQAAAAGKEAEDGFGKIGDRLGHGFERIAIHALGIGAVLQSISAIKQVAEEINKITDSLDKQGELLVENSRHMILQAKFAKDDAGVLKVAEEALKNIAAQHKIVEETQKWELSLAEKIADQVVAAANPGGTGPNAARLEAEKAQAQESEMAARRLGMEAVASAQRQKELAETSSIADAIDRLNQKIREQEALRSRHYQQADIQGYVEASQALEQYRKELELLTKTQEKHRQEAESFMTNAVRSASLQVQRTLQQEEAARRTGDEAYQRSAEAFKRGFTPEQTQEYEGLKSAGEQKIIDAINELRQENERQHKETMNIWR